VSQGSARKSKGEFVSEFEHKKEYSPKQTRLTDALRRSAAGISHTLGQLHHYGTNASNVDRNNRVTTKKSKTLTARTPNTDLNQLPPFTCSQINTPFGYAFANKSEKERFLLINKEISRLRQNISYNRHAVDRQDQFLRSFLCVNAAIYDPSNEELNAFKEWVMNSEVSGALPLKDMLLMIIGRAIPTHTNNMNFSRPMTQEFGNKFSSEVSLNQVDSDLNSRPYTTQTYNARPKTSQTLKSSSVVELTMESDPNNIKKPNYVGKVPKLGFKFNNRFWDQEQSHDNKFLQSFGKNEPTQVK
jgi:hypothetical protein